MASLARLCRAFASVSLGSSSASTALACGQVAVPRIGSCSFHSIAKSTSLDSFKCRTLQFAPLLSKQYPGSLNQLDARRGYLYYSFKDPLTPYLKRYIDRGPPKKKPKKFGPTEGRPFLKGVVLKTMIKKPKKPNSANRKCVRVRLSTGREATAYIPGIGHNLQEHHTVLVRGGRVQDLPGVKLKCVRGKYDLAHVKKVTT